MVHCTTPYSRQHLPSTCARMSKLQQSRSKHKMTERTTPTPQNPEHHQLERNHPCLEPTTHSLGAVQLVRSSRSGSTRRLKGLRGKSLEGIAHDALQSYWCAFIRTWKRILENESRFPQWLANTEDHCADHSISALREEVCEHAWNKNRLCFVYANEDVSFSAQCYVHLATNGTDLSLSAQSANVNKPGSGSMSAVFTNSGLRLLTVRLAGVTTLGSES